MGVFAPFYPRIHITLLDLSRNGYRSNGGLGFCIDTNESAGLHAVRNAEIDLSMLAAHGIEQCELDQLTELLIRIQTLGKFAFGLAITKVSGIRRHFGFGSGTYIRLACIAMLARLNGETLSRQQMLQWSGRGGASGVGISTFFDGGISFDLGRPRDDGPLTSSDLQLPGFALPTRMASAPMPSWRCGIILPKGARPISLEEERKFFVNTTPLDDADVHAATYHSLLGVYASVLDENYASFCSAINALQKVTWKAAEIRLHGDRVSGLIETLRAVGCDAAGMSSLGPCVYFFASEFDKAISEIARTVPHEVVLAANVRNAGCALIDE